MLFLPTRPDPSSGLYPNTAAINANTSLPAITLGIRSSTPPPRTAPYHRYFEREEPAMDATLRLPARTLATPLREHHPAAGHTSRTTFHGRRGWECAPCSLHSRTTTSPSCVPGPLRTLDETLLVQVRKRGQLGQRKKSKVCCLGQSLVAS